MVVAFGWSAGDIVAGIRVTVKICEAFKESGGAASKYKQTVDFLDGFKLTLEHLKTYIDGNPADSHASSISDQIEKIKVHFESFQNAIEKYEKALGEASTTGLVKKVSRKMRWTLKEMSGDVDNLKAAVMQPLQIINTLLSLQMLDSLDKTSSQPLSPVNCRQLVEAIHLAAMPACLEQHIVRLQSAVEGQATTAEAANTLTVQELDSIREKITSAEASISQLIVPKDSVAITQTLEKVSTMEKRLDMISQQLDKSELEALARTQQKTILELQAFLEATAEAHSRSSENCSENYSAESSAEPGAQPSIESAAKWVNILLSSIVALGVITGAVEMNISISPIGRTRTRSKQRYDSSIQHVTSRRHRIIPNPGPRITTTKKRAAAKEDDIDTESKRLDEFWNMKRAKSPTPDHEEAAKEDDIDTESERLDQIWARKRAKRPTPDHEGAAIRPGRGGGGSTWERAKLAEVVMLSPCSLGGEMEEVPGSERNWAPDSQYFFSPSPKLRQDNFQAGGWSTHERAKPGVLAAQHWDDEAHSTAPEAQSQEAICLAFCPSQNMQPTPIELSTASQYPIFNDSTGYHFLSDGLPSMGSQPSPPRFPQPPPAPAYPRNHMTPLPPSLQPSTSSPRLATEPRPTATAGAKTLPPHYHHQPNRGEVGCGPPRAYISRSPSGRSAWRGDLVMQDKVRSPAGEGPIGERGGVVMMAYPRSWEVGERGEVEDGGWEKDYEIEVGEAAVMRWEERGLGCDSRGV
ncbi:hypothetical protein BU16DRAFT_583936 [Lophium mytilinum]|uniref:Fungal N-terminal domain-containing protein n=1 Tax=Lophium mytilinum TaxID=390894 RepID=A0A6A6QMA8_9PEZI|nr:hypothetical protein BU16DRAFT_583936 [Lophium mytilinum]